ncbi:hypothetical protein GCM10010172_39600 [Paractinoplanes ferrugineus]|uniref:Uncharacterized protein n=1 Tax=Paractinoplanes ferrugineus TaxID=113564 RepID=A0A919MM01_9ACTN|nr:DUF6182 family protein [Actinoplanes ferrugineus]GIE12737.1 hypothetical protein Afe05nite_45770 [Actinoplanes ferrugineus]
MSGSPQELLAAAAVARLEDAAGSGTAGPGLSVAVVVQDFEAEPFFRSVIQFALAVPKAEGEAWQRAFTRTIFLAGRPDSLAQRFTADLNGPAGSVAWYGPAREKQLRNLSRMLRAFQGDAPVLPPPGSVLVRAPGPPSGTEHTATIATRDVSFAGYLVHTHHLFAEATLRGLIRPGDTIRVEHRGELDGPLIRTALDPALAPGVQTRITHDGRDPDRLRLYAVLVAGRKGDEPCKPTAS